MFSLQVGNKADLVGSRQVQQGTANGKAGEWNVRTFVFDIINIPFSLAPSFFFNLHYNCSLKS